VARKRREYSDEQRAEALALLDANEGNVRRTARELGIPRGTLLSWKDKPKAGVSKLRPQKRGSLFEAGKNVAWLLAGKLQDEEKLRKASYRDIATSFGIVVDKLEVLRKLEMGENPRQMRTPDLTDEQLLTIATGGGNGTTEAASSPPSTD